MFNKDSNVDQDPTSGHPSSIISMQYPIAEDTVYSAIVSAML